MTQILGKYLINVTKLREIALIIHGLDKSTDSLFSENLADYSTESLKKVANGLISENILHLAISVRSVLYQGVRVDDGQLFNDCGIYYEEHDMKCVPFTLKDICDKIIHAESAYKDIWRHEQLRGAKMCFNFDGKKGSKVWHLGLSLELFCVCFFRWCDLLEELHNQSLKGTA